MYFLVKFTHKLASNAWIGLEKPIWDEVTKPMGVKFSLYLVCLGNSEGGPTWRGACPAWPIENT